MKHSDSVGQLEEVESGVAFDPRPFSLFPPCPQFVALSKVGKDLLDLPLLVVELCYVGECLAEIHVEILVEILAVNLAVNPLGTVVEETHAEG